MRESVHEGFWSEKILRKGQNMDILFRAAVAALTSYEAP